MANFANKLAKQAYIIASKNPNFKGSWHYKIKLTLRDLDNDLYTVGVKNRNKLTVADIKTVARNKRRQHKKKADIAREADVEARGYKFGRKSVEAIFKSGDHGLIERDLKNIKIPGVNPMCLWVRDLEAIAKEKYDE